MLQGGTVLFNFVQNIFKLKDSCDEKCLQDFQENFIYEKDLKNKTLFVQKKNIELDPKKPILFFFCGIGVKESKYRLQNYLNSPESKCFNPIIFSLDLFSIHDINKMIENATNYFFQIKQKYNNFSFVFVGHSLGSGIACSTTLQILKILKSNNIQNTTLYIKHVFLISTYPNISNIFSISFLKNLAKYLFENVLDNENCLEEICKLYPEFASNICILQGKKDKFFPPFLIKNMIKKKSCFSSLRFYEIDGNHYDPAEVKLWGNVLCQLS